MGDISGQSGSTRSDRLVTLLQSTRTLFKQDTLMAADGIQRALRPDFNIAASYQMLKRRYGALSKKPENCCRGKISGSRIIKPCCLMSNEEDGARVQWIYGFLRFSEMPIMSGVFLKGPR
jgi:hypothetical protein